MLKRITSSIAGASLVLALVNLLSKGFGFLKDMYIASSYGLGEELDTYLAGTVIPISITTLLIYFGQNYLIPLFDKIKLIEDSKQRAKIQTINFVTLLFISILLAGILFTFSDLIIKVYLVNNSTYFNKTIDYFNIVILSIPVYIIIAFYLSYLQSKFDYRHTAFSYLVVNSSMLIIILILQPIYGIYSLPLSYTISALLQAFYLFLKSKDLEKFNFKVIFNKENYKLFSITTISSIMAIEIIGQLYLISDRYFYNQVDPGGLSALNYGYNLTLLPVNIFSVAISTALFPQMSFNFNRNKSIELSKNVLDGLKINLFFLIPIIVLLFFKGDYIISFLFERGKFTQLNTSMTFEIVKCLSLSILFASWYQIFNRLLYSSGNSKSVLLVSIIAVSVKVILNFVLVKYYSQVGLALAFTASYFFFLLTAFIMIRRKTEIKVSPNILKKLFIYLLLSIIIILLLEYLNSLIIINGLVLITLFYIIYYGILFLMKDENYAYIKRFYRTALSPGKEVS